MININISDIMLILERFFTCWVKYAVLLYNDNQSVNPAIYSGGTMLVVNLSWRHHVAVISWSWAAETVGCEVHASAIVLGSARRDSN